MTQSTPLRVLITNNTLATRAGSELYVRDLALGLIQRGHRPVVYSTSLGEVAEGLHRATVPIVEDLGALGFVPDVIHGQHHLETMTAVLHFPQVPAVYFCHGWLPWEEMPPVHPSIRRYVAVDDLCAERLLTTEGIDPGNTETIYNGVDLNRFVPRSPLPGTPGSALIFSNYAETKGYAETIKSACASYGIERVDVVGVSVRQGSDRPEELLANYDVVFAKARCALEAMATGCATIVADRAGLGGMVGMDNVARYRRLNFGVRTMQAQAISAQAVLDHLRAYDPGEAQRVSAWIRSDAAFETVVDRIVETYRRALAQAPAIDPVQSAAASARYLSLLSPRLKSVHDAERRAQKASEGEASLRQSESSLQEQIQAQRILLETERGHLEAEHALRLDREQEVARRESELLHLRTESSKFADALTMSVAQQAEISRQAAERENELLHWRREAVILGEKLGAIGKMAAEQEQELVQSRREVVILGEQLVAIDEKAAVQEAELLQARREASSLDEQLGAINGQLAVRDSELLQSQREAAVLGEQLSELRQQQARFRQQLDAIHGSKSWRALAVYRRLRAWLF